MRRLLPALLALAVLACGDSDRPEEGDKTYKIRGEPHRQEHQSECEAAMRADELNARAADPDGKLCHVCFDGTCDGWTGYWGRDATATTFQQWDEDKYADRHEACEDIQAFSFAEQWCSE